MTSIDTGWDKAELDHGGTLRLLRPFLLRHWRSLAGALLCHR